jgi:hypothetical protein
MDKKPSSIGIYIKVAILIIGLIVAYILLPNSWENLGNTYKPRTVEKEGGPTPTSLQFKNPFKYDKNANPPKKIEPKQHENGAKDKSIFWK